MTWLSTVRVVSAQSDKTDTRKNECLVAYAEAQEQRMRGSLLEAREQLLICDSAECPRPIMGDCSEWLRDVESDLSSVVFAVSDDAGRDVASASVSVNGKPIAGLAEGRAQLLDPGSYEFSVEAPGFVRVDGSLVMRQSEKNRIVRVQLERPGAPLPAAAVASDASDGHFHVPTASIVLGASAAVGVASFAFFGLRGQGKRADLDSCTMSCAGLIDSGKRDYIIADISLGVAVAAAAGAVVIALVDREPAQPSAGAAGSRLAVGPASVEWSLRF